MEEEKLYSCVQRFANHGNKLKTATELLCLWLAVQKSMLKFCKRRDLMLSVYYLRWFLPKHTQKEHKKIYGGKKYMEGRIVITTLC